MTSLDPVVHGALVTIATYLINQLFALLGLDLGGEIATQLAQIIVAYILSLFGLGLYYRATSKVAGALAEERYKPPFS